MNSSRQFSLAILLSWVTAFAFFIVTTRWALTSTILGTPETMPLAYEVGFPLMLFGVIIAPFLIIICLIVIVSLSIGHVSTSISSLMFVGYGCLAVLGTGISPVGNWWQAGVRILILLVLSSAACIAETHYRDLPDWHRWVAGISMVVPISYFIHLAAIAALSAF